jgi:enediyne biosynthesis protein E4
MLSRRRFVKSLCAALPVFSLDQLCSGLPLGVQFVNVAKQAGLDAKTIFGAENSNKYLLETTGCGVAFFDYDNDGWLDIFFVNGTRFETTFSAGAEPVSRLYKNNRDGTFTDVTFKAGLARTGWGQGVCAGDYDNDGHDDLFVSYWGDCALYRNNGNGTFTDVAAKAGVTTHTTTGLKRWNTGCAFLDYDRDGHLDLYVANYIDFDPKTAPLPESGHAPRPPHPNS